MRMRSSWSGRSIKMMLDDDGQPPLFDEDITS